MKIPEVIFKQRLKFSEQWYNFLATMTGLTVFTIEFFRQAFIRPLEVREIKKHMDELGVKTFPIVTITGFIIGFVLALQTQPILAKFGATEFLPAMVAISVVRELGPVITALIFAGRVSSGIGAELGSMRVTEQIDAMDVSGVNPFKYLVVTRIIATTIILPILTIYVIFLAMVGCFIAVIVAEPTSLSYFIDTIIEAIAFEDLIPGISKTFVFGFLVGLVGCYKGYTTVGGTEGVGKSSTTSVVIASMLILIVDAVLVKLTALIW
ncbi:MAG: ABC transporter permease [Ignavibacteriales bacterium]|nr:ABC transporter permease [Ignavibacteriales bacterium]